MLKIARQEAVRRSAVVLLSVLIVLRDLFTNLVYLRPVPALHSYILELLIIGQLWTLCLRTGEKTKMERLLLGYGAWAVLTRFLLLDFRETVSLEVLVLGEMIVAFFAMHKLDQKAAFNIFTIVTAILCGVLTVWAVCGLVIALTDVEEIRLLNEVVQVNTVETCIDFYPINRNETAAWFMTGLWLLAYQWTTCKRRFWRIPMALSMVLMFLTIGLQRGRTTYVTVGFTIGLLAASPLLRLSWKKWCRYLLMAAVTALCTLVIYKSFALINTINPMLYIVAALAIGVLGAIPLPKLQWKKWPRYALLAAVLAVCALAAYKLLARSNAAVPQLPSLSEYFGKRRTITSRMQGWKCEIYAMVHHPLLLLFGQPEMDIPLNMVRYGGLEKAVGHTHNGFLQVTAMYGLPGLLLWCSFLLPLIRKLLRVLLKEAPVSERILALLLVGLLIHGIMEPMFTARLGLATAMFMLVAGRLTRENTEGDANG